MPSARTLKIAGCCLAALLYGSIAQAAGTATTLLGNEILIGFYDNFGLIESKAVVAGPGEEITDWLAADSNGFSVNASVSIYLGGITISIKSSNERGDRFIDPLFLSFTDINDLLAPFDPTITNVSWITSNATSLPPININADSIILDMSNLLLPMASTGNGLLVNIAFDSTTLPPTDVPEPNLSALLGLGAALAAWNRNRRRR